MRIGLLAVASIAALSACVKSESPLGPSALILPDAITVTAGNAQTFTVQNASVRGFTLSGDARDWPACVRLDDAYQVENSVRIVALRRCDGLVYVSADLGAGRSPLVAAMTVQ